MRLTTEKPKAPRHLKAATRCWWEAVCRDWQLEEHHRRILTASCEAWDVMQEAGKLLRSEGLVVTTKAGGPRAHPAVKIAADARLQFFRGVRELDHRDPGGFSHRRIRSELAAERYSFGRSLVWDDACHGQLMHNLMGVLKEGDTSDAGAVVEVESLLKESETTRRPITKLGVAFEEFEFRRQAPCTCEGSRCRDQAVRFTFDRFLCQRCTNEHAIARQRRIRIAQRIQHEAR